MSNEYLDVRSLAGLGAATPPPQTSTNADRPSKPIPPYLIIAALMAVYLLTGGPKK